MRSAVAGKCRVHELAKELGLESKVVLAKLKEMGEFVKSASSTVEPPVARKLKEMFPVGGTAPKSAPADARPRSHRPPGPAPAAPEVAAPAAPVPAPASAPT